MKSYILKNYVVFPQQTLLTSDLQTSLNRGLPKLYQNNKLHLTALAPSNNCSIEMSSKAYIYFYQDVYRNQAVNSIDKGRIDLSEIRFSGDPNVFRK